MCKNRYLGIEKLQKSYEKSDYDTFTYWVRQEKILSANQDFCSEDKVFCLGWNSVAKIKIENGKFQVEKLYVGEKTGVVTEMEEFANKEYNNIVTRGVQSCAVLGAIDEQDIIFAHIDTGSKHVVMVQTLKKKFKSHIKSSDKLYITQLTDEDKFADIIKDLTNHTVFERKLGEQHLEIGMRQSDDNEIKWYGDFLGADRKVHFFSDFDELCGFKSQKKFCNIY